MEGMNLDISEAVATIQNRRKWFKEGIVSLIIDAGEGAKVGMKEKIPAGSLNDSIGNPANEGVYDLTFGGDIIVLRVGTKKKHAGIVNNGVLSHYIIPLEGSMDKHPGNKRWMKFYSDKYGKLIYAKRVMHPPMSGKFFFENGVIMAQQTLIKNARIMAK